MTPPLRAEQLESRDCPAAGSTLVPVDVGPGYTLSVNTYGRVATMQLSAPEWVAWAEGTISNAQAQAMTQRIYQSFSDDFDFIMFVNNLPDVLPTAQYFGVHMGVKNDTLGIGADLFDDTALWGSAGRLQGVIHLASERDLYTRTSLHELAHRNANFLPQIQSAVPSHWGFSGVGGQLGGWAPGTLETLVPGVPGLYDADGPNGRDYFYTAFADIEDGDIPYADLELYLMGLINATELPPLQYAVNAQFVSQPQGIFQADAIHTLTWQNIVEQEGLRTPTPATSQKDFRVLTVVITPNPLTQQELDQFDTDVEYFGMRGPDPNEDILNFWEATGGRATLKMDNLQAFLPTFTSVLGVGTDAGTLVGLPVVNGQYNASLAIRPDLSSFNSGNPSSIRTAVGDVDGDTIPDYAVASGPGVFARFAVISGATNQFLIPPTFPFRGSETFTGGAYVSLGDLDGDGRKDIVITPDEGGGPRVVAFSYKPTTGLFVLADFLGIDDANFRGGARTAVGDVNRDGQEDLAVAAGFGGGPRVSLFDGRTLFTTRSPLTGDFFAFGGADATRLRNGVYLAIGDVDGDGFGDLIFGGGPGGAPRVSVLSGGILINEDPEAALDSPLANFFVANNTADRGGVRVATKSVDGDLRQDIVVGSGSGTNGRIRVYPGIAVANGGEPGFQEINLFGVTLPSGVFVG